MPPQNGSKPILSISRFTNQNVIARKFEPTCAVVMGHLETFQLYWRFSIEEDMGVVF